MHHGPELVPKKTKTKEKENVLLKTFAGRWPDPLSGFQHFIGYSTLEMLSSTLHTTFKEVHRPSHRVAAPLSTL